ASELLKSIKIPTTLHYWRTLQKAELDFVLRSGDGKLTAIEVKAKKMNSISISRSYHSFLNKYSPQSSFLVNLNLRQQANIKNHNIRACTIFDIQSQIVGGNKI
ncbi:MAG TPA: DUF4143 domain-containing protein, partial [Candidatus Portnoybacteria bacterium]|nr:DUF4143 domain-containing protein [Candidatus Portnoybacteria bacterium]